MATIVETDSFSFGKLQRIAGVISKPPTTIIMTSLDQETKPCSVMERGASECTETTGDYSMDSPGAYPLRQSIATSSGPESEQNVNYTNNIPAHGGSYGQSSKQPPRISSLSALLSMGSEDPFQFEPDSPKCSSFMGQDAVTGGDGDGIALSGSPREQAQTTLSQNEDFAYAPIEQDLPVDQDISVGSSVAIRLNSNSRSQPPVEAVDLPTYVSSGRQSALISPTNYHLAGQSKVISPTNYNLPSHQNSKGQTRRNKVQPLVYSAICSLETVNQNNLGSFNYKMHMAAKLKQRKKEQVNLDSNTSKISQRMAQKTSPSEGKGNTGNGLESTGAFSNTRTSKKNLSNLSSTLSSKAENEKLQQQTVPALLNPNINREGEEVPAIEQAKVEQKRIHKKSSAQPKPASIINIESKDLIAANLLKPKKKGHKKNVTIDAKPREIRQVEVFRPSCDAYTPRMGKKAIKFKPAQERLNMENMVTNPMGTIQKPNFQDALRRVAMIIQQHIVKIERRFESGNDHLNLFDPAMRDAFAEENFVTPRYKCTMVKVPMARGGVVYGMRKIRVDYKIPTADDIYEFGHRLFKQVQLSSECSIICLIYVERLMENAKVPVMATTWKPIFMCGLLLASKVWQDWSSWNIEFANVYPQFSLAAINKLELQFLKMVKWDLYISSSLYAKYYFALRSLLEKQDFRRRYVRMVGGVDNVAASQAMKVSKRSELLKEKSLAYLSTSV